MKAVCYDPRQLKNQWREYYNLGINKQRYSALGSTSLSVPEFHRKNLKESSEKMDVCDYQYQQPHKKQFLNQIIKYFPPIKRFQLGGIEIMTQNLTATPGAISGINLAIQTLTSSGDQIILFQPIYPFHLARLQSRRDIVVRTCRAEFEQKQNILKIDFQSLKKVLNEKSRILIICNPCNPTTYIWDKQDFQKLSEIIRNFPNLIVVQDAAYFCYHQQNRPYIPFGSISRQNFNRAVTFYSAGKMFNITGIRVGFVLASPEIISKIIEAQYEQIMILSSQDQYILMNDLRDAAEQDYYQNQRKKHAQIKNIVTKQFTKLGIPFLQWHGTYYLIINVEKYRNKIEEKWYTRMDNGLVTDKHLDKAFARLFYKQYSIGLFPLSDSYFTNPCDQFLRLSFNRNQTDIEFKLQAFRNFVQLNQGQKEID